MNQVLKQHLADLRLDRHVEMIGLGGKENRAAVVGAFGDTVIEPRFAFAGLPIGKAMQATKLEIASKLEI